MATRGKSARLKGHKFELDVMHRFREAGYSDATTSRNESRINDALKVDLCNTGIFSIQCKAQEKLMTGLHDELKQMPDDENINVVFWKRNNKGTVVTMTEEDFFSLISKIK